MDGQFVNYGQEQRPYTYSSVQNQQPFPQPAVSPQTFPGTYSAQPISPQSVERETLPQQPPWIDAADYDRIRDSHRGQIIGNDLAHDAYYKGSDVHVVSEPATGALHERGSLMLRIMKSRASMIACLVIGVGGAVGHHFLYAHLDGQEAKYQQWWLRLGQLISFLANANFILAAVMAHQQVAWRAVGQEGFSITAVDALFGATHNIIELFNREAWVKSWFVMFLALYMWLSPLVVIISSASLYVAPGERIEDVLCPSIRTLNFSNEAKDSFQTRKMAEGEVFSGLSLSSYNWTAEGGNLAEGAKDNDDIFEYYTSPSPALDRIAAGVFSSGQTTRKANVSQEICGDGWDCSTTVHFVGPGYKCEELANGVGSKMKSFGDAPAPFELSKLVPASNYTYWASTDRGEYRRPQMDNLGDHGAPSKDDGPPFPKNLGVFRTEPSIWIGYAAVDDLKRQHANESEADGWNDDYTPIIFACDHWEVNYTVKFNFASGVQKYNITDRDYKRKIIDTTLTSLTAESTDGTTDRSISEPEKNYVSPRNDFARYRRIAAFHSLGLKFREQLSGYVKLQGSPYADGGITKTTLLDRRESLPVQDFQNEVRRLYENLIISLFSDPQLLVVAWASDPSKLSGTGIGGEDTNYKCERRRRAGFFDYSWPVLVSVYAVSFVIASVGVYYGIVAMSSDGTYTQRVMTFSAIAGATKNVSLDEFERRDTKIRCFPSDQPTGERTYEFKAELEG